MHRMNLIPKEIIIERNKKRKKYKYTAIIILVNILSIILCYFLNSEIEEMDKYIDSSEKELAFLKDKLENLHDSYTNIDDLISKKFIDELKKKRQTPRIHVIKDIMKKTSEKIIVESIRINESDNMIIEGKAEYLKSIANFIDSIKTAPFIGDVRINYIKNTSAGIDDFVSVYIFQLTCQVLRD